MIASTRLVLAIGKLAGAVLLAGFASCAGSAAYAAPAAPKAARPAVPAALAAVPSPPAPALEPVPANLPPARAYLFRGALGPFFSTGIDRLSDRITEAGFKAHVYEFTLCDLILYQVIREYRDAPAPIVLIGHSMGGLCSVRLASKLQDEHIPVSLVVAIDPAHATWDVSSNVKRFINIFLSDGVLGGGDVKAEAGYRGHYASYDLKDHKEVSHINIDKMKDVHQQLVSMIKDISTLPATTNEPDPAPLRFLIPPQESIELWDSGISLVARGGETWDQVASYYHVPMWALQQANHGAGNATLTPGQRLVVPRHLLPLAATAAQIPPPQPVPTQR